MSGSANQLEIEKLKTELHQYEEEFQQLKNQDITIRRLEDKLHEYQNQNEEQIEEEVSRRMVLVDAQANDRISEILQRQQTIERRYNSTLEALQEAKLSTDRAQSQLYELSIDTEARLSAMQSENSILAEGSQRLQFRLAETESELLNLKQQSLNNTNNKMEPQHQRDEHVEHIQTLQLAITNLREELMKVEENSSIEKKHLEAVIKDLSSSLNKEKELVLLTKQELSERPGKEEHITLKRQLYMVQKIAFHVEDEDMESSVHYSQLGDPENTFSSSLEALLANRLKALEIELTGARKELHESRQQEASAKDTIATLKLSLETSTQIVTRLETRCSALEESICSVTGIKLYEILYSNTSTA